MKINTIALLLLSLSANVTAGTVVNGVWTPSTCGTKPVTPRVDDKDVDTYNKSVTLINDWQQKAKAYYSCLVDEANSDSAAVVDSATKEQAEYNKSFESIKLALDAAEKKVDK